MPNPTTTTEWEVRTPSKMDYLTEISQHARGYLVDIGAIKYVSYCLLCGTRPDLCRHFNELKIGSSPRTEPDCLCDGIFHLTMKDGEKSGVTNRIKHKFRQFLSIYHEVSTFSHQCWLERGGKKSRKTAQHPEMDHVYFMMLHSDVRVRFGSPVPWSENKIRHLRKTRGNGLRKSMGTTFVI